MQVRRRAAEGVSPPIHGIDFTSAPKRRKPITVASGALHGEVFHLAGVVELDSFAAFEDWLARPGPWIGGFDLPFGLPRAAVCDLGWPTTWPALVRHCAGLDRMTFRSQLDAYRKGRPVGAKYPYRRGDALAGAHSPMKLVNPPVALMFFEGAPRLLAAGLHLPGLYRGDRSRVAIEAYPGFAVRRMFASRMRVSYKNDARAKQTDAQRRARTEIVRRIRAHDAPLGLRLQMSATQSAALLGDGRGDLLDAVLCALQAAWAWRRRTRGYGLPAQLDPLEGWIATVPRAPVLSAPVFPSTIPP